MSEKEIFMAALKGELKDGDKFEFIQPNYDYHKHGVYYRWVLIHYKGYLQKEVYDKDGVWRNTWDVMKSPSNIQYQQQNT
jgi:hypothetical protein